jgi:hypothetical protein
VGAALSLAEPTMCEAVASSMLAVFHDLCCLLDYSVVCRGVTMSCDPRGHLWSTTPPLLKFTRMDRRTALQEQVELFHITFVHTYFSYPSFSSHWPL